LPIDDFVPFWPIWVVPYLMSLIWWLACFIWAAVDMEAWRYIALVAGAVFTMVTSYFVYIFYPTYVIRPEVVANDWASELVRILYANDRLYNAFPSGHTYTTMLILFFWWNWKPGYRVLWLLISVMIVLSTLFTGQHNLADPIGGVIWATLGYLFGMWFQNLRWGLP
jgi:membrane-associated phospholipid phosphatase